MKAVRSQKVSKRSQKVSKRSQKVSKGLKKSKWSWVWGWEKHFLVKKCPVDIFLPHSSLISVYGCNFKGRRTCRIVFYFFLKRINMFSVFLQTCFTFLELFYFVICLSVSFDWFGYFLCWPSLCPINWRTRKKIIYLIGTKPPQCPSYVACIGAHSSRIVHGSYE